MIDVYTGVSGLGHCAATDNMFADRKRVFVDLLRWSVPVIDGAFELDEFDTAGATYFVSSGPAGQHLGSFRMLQTEGPHILGSLFPFLCDGGVPLGPDILEITRGCLSPRLRAAERLRVRNRLIAASVHFALSKGYRAFTCVADSSWLTQILALGWHCEPLGKPRLVDGVVTGALQIHLTEETPGLLRASSGVEGTPFRMIAPVTELAA